MTRSIAVITGASSGIGRAAAIRLSQEGYDLLTFDRNPTLEPLVNETFIQVDLATNDGLEKALAHVREQESVAVLVNNVSTVKVAALADVHMKELHDMALLNLGGSIGFAQAAIPAMTRNCYGRIINIASRAALGKTGRTVYGATKAGLIGMTRTWALELAQFGITVNAVAPGPIQTESFQKWNRPDDPRTQAIRNSVPVQRLGDPQDVAHAIACFADQRAGFITGQVMYVCGGLTVGASAM